MNQFHNSTVTIIVSDLNSAISFYTQILGFDLRQRYGDHYAEINAAGLLLGLHPAETEMNVGNNMSIGFGTKDLDSTIAFLESKGIQLSIKEDGPVRIASFADPDNNSLYAIEI